MELAFFSTNELIEELLRRKTFLGVVVHSEQEYREEEWGPERVFRVRFNANLDTAKTGRLLDNIAEHIGRDEDCWGI